MLNILKRYREYDPAAKSCLEVALLYPGVKALISHRVAHALYRWRVPLVPRLLSELARFFTGIEIHPGARLGSGVIIDHGMGLVIGETAVVGDGVLLYQGVTLGGTSLSPGKRHPTLEEGVVVGAGAKILGDIVIGAHSRVGANSVVVRGVPPNSTVVGIPAKVVARGVSPGHELMHDEGLKSPGQHGDGI